MKNTSKYDTPDLRNVVISKLLKDAEKAFENEQMIDLSEEELYNKAKKEETKPEEKKEEVKFDVAQIIEKEKKVPQEPVEIDYVAKLD